MEKSKFSTTEETTHVFRKPEKSDSAESSDTAQRSNVVSTKKRKSIDRKELDAMEDERRKKSATAATRNARLLSFDDEENEDGS